MSTFPISFFSFSFFFSFDPVFFWWDVLSLLFTTSVGRGSKLFGYMHEQGFDYSICMMTLIGASHVNPADATVDSNFNSRNYQKVLKENYYLVNLDDLQLYTAVDILIKTKGRTWTVFIFWMLLILRRNEARLKKGENIKLSKILEKPSEYDPKRLFISWLNESTRPLWWGLDFRNGVWFLATRINYIVDDTQLFIYLLSVMHTNYVRKNRFSKLCLENNRPLLLLRSWENM